MRKARELVPGDFMITCQQVEGQRRMRICIPRSGPRLTTDQFGIMQLGIDTANICPEGELAARVLRMKGKTRFVLLDVPLEDGVPEKVAMATARKAIDICLNGTQSQQQRTSSAERSSGFDAGTVRVPAQLRSARSISVAA